MLFLDGTSISVTLTFNFCTYLLFSAMHNATLIQLKDNNTKFERNISKYIEMPKIYNYTCTNVVFCRSWTEMSSRIKDYMSADWNQGRIYKVGRKRTELSQLV